MIVEAVTPKLVGYAVDKVSKVMQDAKHPYFDRVCLGGIPPELVATTDHAPNLCTGDVLKDVSPNHYLGCNEFNGWVREVRVRFWLTNPTSTDMKVVGIGSGKSRVENRMTSAILFPPQGATSGDVLRFISNLDADMPSMQRFRIEGGATRVLEGERNFFDEGYVALEHGDTRCFSLIFSATKYAYRIEPYVAIQRKGKKGREVYPIPLDRGVYVYPLADFAEEERFVRSFDPDPPYMLPVEGTVFEKAFADSSVF